MDTLQFLSLGGAREIGANSYFYNFGGYGVLVDAGLHPKNTGWDAFPKAGLLDPGAVDTFIVTHAHTDHLAGVPYLLQSQPQSRVIATKETIEIAKIMLANTASLLPRQHTQEVLNKLQHYSLEKLEEITTNIEPRRFNDTLTLKDATPETSLKATLYMSGHILGAAGVLFEYGNKRIFHTGDTKLREQNIIAGADLPEGPVDVLISESTNGLYDLTPINSREQELDRFLSTIADVLHGGGSVLVPVFALGKTQEALTMIWQGMQSGKIPTVDIYTGGMGRRISEIYDANQYSVSRKDHETVLANIPQIEIPRRDDLFSGKYFKEPSIVLASSGMMQEGTASYMLAQRWLRHEKFSICFIGYTDPRTPGYVVQHAVRGKKTKFGSMKREVNVRCTIERFRFSAHARRDELLQIVEKLRPKHVVLTHGDTDAMNSFGELILETFPGTKVSAPEVGKWYKLLED